MVQKRRPSPARPGALTRRPSARTLAELRGYDRDDLEVVAEIAHHYLFSGNTELALVLFDGLSAVAPTDAHYALGLGVAQEERGDLAAAARAYTRAAKLDPRDGRPDVNLGEMLLGEGDRRRALQYLRRGAQKAHRMGDTALAKKAMAILSYSTRAK